MCPGGNRLSLVKGYWRSSNDSEDIMECNKSPENCQGGEQSGNDSCSA